jgi:hypothetical protein
MQYRLRTLLILLAIGPMALATLGSYSSVSLAVIGWFTIIVFALYISMTDARQHSRFRDD